MKGFTYPRGKMIVNRKKRKHRIEERIRELRILRAMKDLHPEYFKEHYVWNPSPRNVIVGALWMGKL